MFNLDCKQRSNIRMLPKSHAAEDTPESYSNKYEVARKMLFVKSTKKNVYAPHILGHCVLEK